MRAFLAALLVGPDGKPDEQALISIVATIIFLGLFVYTVVALKQAFDADKFGLGLGGLAAHRWASAKANVTEQGTQQ